ncbi:MAG TPA: hypothetical protein DCY31_08250 [Ruminococcaceae bacterium]|nr:hypothetical protein [Oscillospiraceae bacterium]
MSGKMLIPGLINCHNHCPMVLLRGVGSDLPLQQWLFDTVFPIEDKLTAEEIKRCEADPKASLRLNESDLPALSVRSKGARYTPMAKRQDKPDAIAWILKHHPELSDAQIRKLLGTTNNSIDAIRNRTHWNMPNIKARNPVLLGLCTEIDLKKAVEVAPKSLKNEAAPLDVEDAEE